MAIAQRILVMMTCLMSMSTSVTLATWCPDGYRLGNGTLDGVCHLMSCLNRFHNDHHEDVHASARYVVTNNVTTSICMKPIQSFLQCQTLTGLSSRQYRIVDDVQPTLWIPRTNVHLPLGQFVMLTDGTVLVCDRLAGPMSTDMAPLPRLPAMCMPFTLPSSLCRPANDGSLVAVNATFRPGFFRQRPSPVPAQEYDLCYGLSDSFVQCPYRGRLPARYSYTRPADMSLYTNLSVELVYELGTYAWTANRKSSVVCVNALRPYRVDAVLVLLTEVSMIASTVCLLATVCVHLFCSNRTNHTRVLVCHTLSLLVMYASTTARYLLPVRDATDAQCYALFSVTYVATLGSFLWLNVLAYELWRAFAHLRPTVAGTASASPAKCTYAWGIPIGLCVVALNVITNSNMQDVLNLKLPMRHFCWFVEDRAIFVFLYAIVIVVLVVNTIFFVITAFNVHRASQGTEILNKKAGHQMFKIGVKLFVVMGLFWFAEFFTWLFRTASSSWPHPIDLINALQGVVIFVVYVVKAKTLRTCRDTLGLRRKRTGRIGGSWSAATNSTSLGDTGTSVTTIKKRISSSRSNSNSGQKLHQQLQPATLTTST